MSKPPLSCRSLPRRRVLEYGFEDRPSAISSSLSCYVHGPDSFHG